MKIGIVGAGTMGSGIAQVFASAEGFSVVLCDATEELAASGKARIAKSLKKQVDNGKMEQAKADTILSGITTGPIEAVCDCDLVEEAVLEKMSLKKEIFQSLQAICRRDTLFASNTSSLSLTEISQGLGRPVVGMHFFNPAPVMKLIEVIAGMQAKEADIKKIRGIAVAIGKVPVVVKDSAGFVVNRVLIPMINEAVGIYAEGIASAEDIDLAMKLGANHQMGPLALGDLVGLDVCLAIMDVLYSETGDSKYRPHPLLKKMVRANLLGKKTGRGFFDYGP